MEQTIELAWRGALERFKSLEAFVAVSDETAPIGDLEYTTELYSSWILLAYATHESAITSYAAAALKVIAACSSTPDDLPEEIKAQRLRKTVALANVLLHGDSSRNPDPADPEEVLRRAYSADWAIDSVLMRLDRNAWPSNIRELFSRINVRDNLFAWSKQPWDDGSETLESRINNLVRERNDLAHGNRPDNLESAESMLDWIAATREYSRQVKCAVQASLLADFASIPTSTIGEINEDLHLGDNTVGFRTVHQELNVDDHVLFRSSTNEISSARVVSMMSDGVSIASMRAGAERVAVTFNRRALQSVVLTTI